MTLTTTRGSRRQPRYITLQVVLGILMVYFLVPFWWVVVNSSKSSSGLFGGGSALWFSDDIDYLGNLTQLFTYGGGIYGLLYGYGTEILDVTHNTVIGNRAVDRGGRISATSFPAVIALSVNHRIRVDDNTVTSNTGEFARVRGLLVEDWQNGP